MNQPHGGTLVNRIATGARKEELEAKAKKIFNLTIEDRYGADVEMIAIGAFSPITGLICLTCLAFLFFESVFGICLGCKFYPIFHKSKPKLCPGEVCDLKSKQEIQKTSITQLIVLTAFFVVLFFAAFFFKEQVSREPHDLFGISGNSKSK